MLTQTRHLLPQPRSQPPRHRPKRRPPRQLLQPSRPQPLSHARTHSLIQLVMLFASLPTCHTCENPNTLLPLSAFPTRVASNTCGVRLAMEIISLVEGRFGEKDGRLQGQYTIGNDFLSSDDRLELNETCCDISYFPIDLQLAVLIIFRIIWTQVGCTLHLLAC